MKSENKIHVFYEIHVSYDYVDVCAKEFDNKDDLVKHLIEVVKKCKKDKTHFDLHKIVEGVELKILKEIGL